MSRRPEMMPTPAANPYVHRIRELPEHILTFYDKMADDAADAAVNARLKSFKKAYCEIGSGSGRHFLHHAINHPDQLWTGFELRYKRICRTAEKARDANLGNVLLLHTEGERLMEIFPKNSLNGIFILFPDPWPKPKWHKNRIINPGFMDGMHACLKTGGTFTFKTDHEEYFNHALRILNADTRFDTIKMTRDLHGSEWAAGNVMTEFEILFKSKRKPVFFLEMIRK